MTWQRLVHRNGLTDGDYNQAPTRWNRSPGGHVGLDEEFCGFDSAASLARAYRLQYARLTESLTQQTRAATMLAGDLRRLETDTMDEGATCLEIARRTDYDVDTVAGILKEFIQW